MHKKGTPYLLLFCSFLFVCVTTKREKQAVFAKCVSIVTLGLPPLTNSNFFKNRAFLMVHVLKKKFNIWDIYHDCQTELHLHIVIFFFFSSLFLCANQNSQADKPFTEGGTFLDESACKRKTNALPSLKKNMKQLPVPQPPHVVPLYTN